jgi:hypothetical protein
MGHIDITNLKMFGQLHVFWNLILKLSKEERKKKKKQLLVFYSFYLFLYKNKIK